MEGHSTTSIHKSRDYYTYHGHDYPEFLPLPGVENGEVPLALMTVEESVHYPVLGYESDDRWFSITSDSWGYVRLGPDDRQFVVTMFHELHCLRMLSRAFSKAGDVSPDHVKHCLNYIRQGVLCAPDLTLEFGNFEDRDFTSERTGATHVCRDWSLIYTAMDENFRSWTTKRKHPAE